MEYFIGEIDDKNNHNEKASIGTIVEYNSKDNWFDFKVVKPIPDIRVIVKDKNGIEHKYYMWHGKSWIYCADGTVIKTGYPAAMYFSSDIDVVSSVTMRR